MDEGTEFDRRKDRFLERFRDLLDESFEEIEGDQVKEITKKLQRIIQRKIEKKEGKFNDLFTLSNYHSDFREKIVYSGRTFKFGETFEKYDGEKLGQFRYFDYKERGNRSIEIDEVSEEFTNLLEREIRFTEVKIKNLQNNLLVFISFEKEIGWAVYNEKMEILTTKTFEIKVFLTNMNIKKEPEHIEIQEAYWNDILKFGPLVLTADNLRMFSSMFPLDGTVSFSDYFNLLKLKNIDIFNLYSLVDGYKRTIDSFDDFFEMLRQTFLKIAEIDDPDILIEKAKAYVPKKCEAQAKNGNACKNYAIDGTFCSRHRH